MFLSRVLRDKLEQKTRRWEGMERADEWVELGEAEARWERVVAGAVRKEIALAEEDGNEGEEVEGMKRWLEEGEGREFGESKERFYAQETGVKPRRSTWAVEAARQKFEIWGRVSEENEKALEKGKRMLEIVEKERALYELERKERRDAKRAVRGKGPGGPPRGGKLVVDITPEIRDESVVKWTPVGSSDPNDLKLGSSLKTAQTEPDKGSQWAKWQPKGTENSLETEEDMMERKTKAMQLAQRNAETASKNARPTF